MRTKVAIQRARAKYNAKLAFMACESRRAFAGGRALRTLEECAKILGISRQACQYLERSALFKIRVGLIAAVREENPAMAAQLEKMIQA